MKLLKEIVLKRVRVFGLHFVALDTMTFFSPRFALCSTTRSASAAALAAALILSSGATPLLHAHVDLPNVAGAVAAGAVASHSSAGHAWATIETRLGQMDEVLNKGELSSVHALEASVSASLRWLKEHGGEPVPADKKGRWEAALKQAEQMSGNLHVAADGGDEKQTRSELKKLHGALKLVAVQYPAEALKAPSEPVAPLNVAAAGHQHHASAVPTTTVAVRTTAPFQVGKEAEVLVSLTKPDGSPMLHSDLVEAHTEKIHLLIIDPSLTDYHHEHPEPTGTPGEYRFRFTPRKPGSYRLWADLIPTASGAQEYAIADISAPEKGEPIANRALQLSGEHAGLRYRIEFERGALEVGKAVLGKLKITKPDGARFDSLEPVMGAYAHIVGFGEDYKSIAHVHPMGTEPTKPEDRGEGELAFHLLPEQPGLMRLFVQVQIDGQNVFVPFTLNVQASAAKVAIQPATGAPEGSGGALSVDQTARLKELLGAYVQVQRTLAADSMAGVKEATNTMASVLNGDKSGLYGAEKSAEIIGFIKEVARQEKIADARKAFRPLSHALIATLEKRKATTGFYIAHCPMADASWIQAGRDLRNPYYGSEMLTCGSINGQR